MIDWLKSLISKLLSLFKIRIKMTYLDSLKALHKRYVDALASNDKRTSSELRGVLVKLYGYVHRYNTAVNTGKDLEAANSKAEIEAILTANGLTVTEDGFFKQIPLIVASKPAIFIPTDSNGDLVYTDATFDVDVWLNGAIDTDNFTLSKVDGTGVTSSLTDNTVTISNLTEPSFVDITATRAGYEDVAIRISVLEHKDGVDGVDGDDGISIISNPGTISVRTDVDGNNPDFTGANSDINIYIGSQNDTSNWTISVQSQTNVTSSIQNDNELVVTGLTADEGEVIVRSEKGGDTHDIPIKVRRVKDGKDGNDGADGTNGTDGSDGEDAISAVAFPGYILIPADSDGSNPDFTNAKSTISVFIGDVDDTANWSLSIITEENVTASISTSDVVISAITADTGLVVVRAAKVGFSSIDIKVNVRKLKDAEAVLGSLTFANGIYQHNVTISTDDGTTNTFYFNGSYSNFEVDSVDRAYIINSDITNSSAPSISDLMVVNSDNSIVFTFVNHDKISLFNASRVRTEMIGSSSITNLFVIGGGNIEGTDNNINDVCIINTYHSGTELGSAIGTDSSNQNGGARESFSNTIGPGASTWSRYSTAIGPKSITRPNSGSSIATGIQAFTDIVGERSHNSVYSAAVDDPDGFGKRLFSYSDFNRAVQTTDDTPTSIQDDYSGGGSEFPGSNDAKIFILDDFMYKVEVDVFAVSITNPGEHFTQRYKGVVQNIGGTTSISAAFTAQDTLINDISGLSDSSVSFGADNTNNALTTTVTGIASTKIRWNIVYRLNKIDLLGNGDVAREANM